MSIPLYRRHIRRTLAITTALAGGCLSATGWAQSSPPNLPKVADGEVVATSGGLLSGGLLPGSPAISRPSDTSLKVELKADNTVINWKNGFNIPVDATAEFTDGRLLPLPLLSSRNIAVLNMDMSGGNTQILGNLQSSSNVAVWVYNPKGILVGSGARINTGSLVLTTLKPDQANFLAGGDAGGRYGLQAGSTAAGDIVVQPNVTITLSNANRGLIMVAPKITSAATVVGGNQDVAFITASDVTLNYGLGSPLSVTLNKGTDVTGNSQLVTGSVSGRNVVFALASQAMVMDALLKVDASVTSASSGDNGIVLMAGRSGSGVTVGGSAADTGGLAGISGSGQWRATNDGVTVGANGAIGLTSTLQSGDDIVVAAGGLASVAGAVTSGGDYRVSGTGVTLGGRTPVTQSAVGAVDIASTNGTLSGLGGLKLQSNSNSAGSESLTLSTKGTTGGDIVFASGSSIEGGPSRNSDVRIGVRAATNAVTLGDVTARGLLGAVGAGAYTNGLSIDGPLVAGKVNTQAALSLSAAAGLTADNLTSGDRITLNSAGALLAGNIDAGGDVTLNGTGATTLSGSVVARGTTSDIVIARNGAVSVTGPVTAGRNLTVGTGAAPAASIAMIGNVSARDVSLITSGAQTYGGTLTAGGRLTATAGGAFSANGAITAANDVALTGANLSLNSVTSTGDDITLAATAGNIAGITPAGVRLTAGDALTATATNGSVAVANAIASGGILKLAGTGGVTAGVLNGSNDVIIDAGSSAAILSDVVTAGRNYTVTGGSVTLGSTATVTQAAKGAVTINGGAGGIAGLGRLTLQSNSDGVGTEALELATADMTTGGIGFASGTTLRGGAAQQSDVVIRSGTADGSVTLGNVVARNLLGAVGTAAATNGITRTSALTLGDVALTGPLSLSGAGLTAGNLTANNGVTLNSSAGLTTGAVATAGNFAAVAAGNLAVASARGDTGVNLSSTGGNVDLAGAINATRGNVTVAAAGAARLPGAVTAGGNYRVTGGSVTLGGTQSASDAVTIAATSGVLTGLSGLSLTSGNDGQGAEPLALSATAGIALAADTVLNGGTARQGAVIIDGGNAAITLGAVNARSLALNGGQPLVGALTTGNVSLVDNLSITGGAAGIKLGDVSIANGGLTIGAVDGLVDVGGVTVSRDVALSGARVTYGIIVGGAVDLRSVGTTATSISGGTIDARGAVTITAADGIGGVRTDAITTASNLTINSVGEIRLDGVDAGGTANIATLVNPADVLFVNGLTAGGTVTIASTRDVRAPFLTSTGGSLAISAPNGDLTGFLPNTAVQLNTGVGGGYTLDIGRAVRLGTLTGGPVSLRADSIDVLAINVGTNLVKLFADNGDLTVRNGITGGLVDLRAAGAVSVGGTINASDAVTLSAISGLTFGTIRGTTIAASSGGAIIGGAVRGTGAIDLTSASLRVGDVTSTAGAITIGATSGALSTGAISAATGFGATAAGDLLVDSVAVSGGNASLVSTGGDARLGSGTASGDIVLRAAGRALSPGAITAGGSYQVTGGTVALGGATQQAAGQMAITATSGGISGGQGLSLVANTGATRGEGLFLDAAGAIDLLGSNIAVRNGGGLGLSAGTGKTVTLGNVDAGLIGGIATVSTGGRSVSALFAHDAAFTAGTLRAQDIGVALSAGDLMIGTVATTGATRLSTATGNIAVGTITADTIALDAGGALVGGTYTAAGANSVAAGRLALTGLGSTSGPVTAVARAGDLAIDTVTAGTTATLTGSGAVGVRSITANGLALDAGGVVSGGAYAIKGAASVAGQSIALTTLTSDTGDVTATARRDGVTIDRIAAGGTATLSAAGAIAINGLSANALSATAGGAVSGGVFTTIGAASMTGQSIGIASLASDQGAVTATTTGGDLSIDQVRANGLATLSGTGAATVGTLVANALTMDMRGAIAGGAFTTTGLASVAGKSVKITTLTTDTGDVAATARDGGLTVDRVATGGAATLSATGAIAINGLAAKTLSATAGGAVSGGAYTTTGAASVTGQSIGIASLTSDQAAITAATTGGDLSIGQVRANGLATLSGTGAATVGTLVANGLAMDMRGAIAGGDFAVKGPAALAGQSVKLTTLTTTGGDVTATARGDGLAIDRVAVGGGAALSAAKAITIGGLTANTLAATAGGAVSGGDFTTSGPASVTGQSITIGGLTASTGAVTANATGGDLAIGRVGAGGLATISGTNAVTVGTLATNALTMTAGGVVSGETYAVKGAASVVGQAVNLAKLTSDTGDVVVTARRDGVAIDRVTAGGTATLSAPGTIAIGGLTANMLAATAGGAVTGGDFVTTGAASLAGQSVAITGLVSNGGAVTANATGGDLQIGRVGAGGLATISGAGAVNVGTVAANALTLDGRGAVSGGNYAVKGAASVTGQSVKLANLTTDTGDVVATARRDGVTIDRIAAGGTATLSAPGAIAIGGLSANALAATAGGAVTGGDLITSGLASVTGQSVAITGLVSNGGAVTANATGGDMSIGRVGAGGLATITGTGAVNVGTVAANALTLDARGAVSGGNYAVKGAASVTGQSVKLTNLTTDTGDVVATARRDGVAIDRIAAGGTATLSAPGAIVIGGLTANALAATAGGALTGGELVTSGLASIAGQSIAITGLVSNGGAATANATGGDVSIGRVGAGGLATITGTGAVNIGALVANTLALDARGVVSGGSYAVKGAAALAGQSIAIAGLSSDTADVTANARSGDLSIDRLSAGGAATANATGAVAIGQFAAKGAGAITAVGGGIRVDSATASGLALKAAGDIAGRSAAGATLAATTNDLSVASDRSVSLAGATVGGNATVTGSDIRISGGLSAARALLVQARNALTMGDATAGTTVSLTAANGLTTQALKAGGDATLKAGGVLSTGAIDTGGTLGVTGGGDVSLASSRATGATTIDAVGIATLGQTIAGPSLTIKASDARLSGTQRAANVTFENRTGDTSALRLGDGTVADGFQLSDAEIKLVDTDVLTFRQGQGAVEIGTVSFSGDAGRRTVNVLGTGRMTVNGVVSGTGAGRVFRFGGTSGSDTDTASAIHVAATSTAGGRLLFDGADLDLRGNRIAVGLGSGFIDLLNDDATVTQVVAGLVGNANSSLYNANLGGGFYDPATPTTVSARSLTIRYGDYALFQNTGIARVNTGILLGGTPSAPVAPALSLMPSTTVNTFAAFGTINGVGASAAALLGPSAVSLGAANVSTSRINGCVVGSGAGCLTAIVIQPTLQVFSASQADVFGSVADLTVPFDPLVGGANEELLTGLTALAPRADCTENCATDTKENRK